MSGVHDTLVKARNLIEQQDEVPRGIWGSPRCGYCAAGALAAVTGDPDPYSASMQKGPVSRRAALLQLAAAITETTPPSLGDAVASIAEFNDSHNLTEVLAAYDAAIKATA
jgi:hypothetical protein